MEGPHNGSGREAWPTIYLRAPRVVGRLVCIFGVFLTPLCILNPMTDLDAFQPTCCNYNPMVYFKPLDRLGDPQSMAGNTQADETLP